MLNKGKKPEAKAEAKESPQVATAAAAAPLRSETPKLLRAALEMTEKSSGLKGVLAKVKEKTNAASQHTVEFMFYLLIYRIDGCNMFSTSNNKIHVNS